MKKIIIIGSGIGGLVSGNLLCKKGHKVTIFESNHIPGGYTSGFWRNGFYFESGTFSFENSHDLFKLFKEIGIFEKLSLVRQKIRLIRNDFELVLDDYQKFKEKLFQAYPTEQDNLEKFFKELDGMYFATKGLFCPGESFFSFFKRAWAGIKFLKFFKKYSNVTTGEFTEKYFKKDSELYNLFANFGYPDMSASFLGGSFVTVMDDYWTFKDGMQSLADALSENFQKLGGELKLKSYVDKIITKDGKAIGVSCNGQDYFSDYVICASDYKNALLNLLDDKNLVPDELQEKIKNAQVSEGMFTAYLGLNLHNDELKKYLKSHYTISDVTVYSHSLLNPKLAPEGKSSLMIQEVALTDWAKDLNLKDREQYFKFKEEKKKELIQKASKIIPDLENHIEFIDVATPATYEKFTHNVHGATSAWSWNPKKKFYENLLKTHIDTPVKNLLIGSCWAMQMGGVPGAVSAAKKCVKRI